MQNLENWRNLYFKYLDFVIWFCPQHVCSPKTKT